MAYQMTATAVTLNDFEGHSLVAGFFRCNPSNICAAFYTISTQGVLVRFLCISRVSCQSMLVNRFNSIALFNWQAYSAIWHNTLYRLVEAQQAHCLTRRLAAAAWEYRNRLFNRPIEQTFATWLFHFGDILKSLHWLKVKQGIDYKVISTTL